MDFFNKPVRIAGRLDKYNNGRTPADGEPDEVEFFYKWFEMDGTEITDPLRIAELDEANPLPEVAHGIEGR
jgi:hypothetical protein